MLIGDVCEVALNTHSYILISRDQLMHPAWRPIWNTSTIAPQNTESNEKGTRYLEVNVGHPLTSRNKCKDLSPKLRVGHC
jgi:hypothetical protein